MTDQDIETQIRNKNLNAPRVDLDMIRDLMARVEYKTVVPEGTNSTFVHAFLDGSFHLASGFSACVSAANFDAEIGFNIAFPKAVAAAREKLWELEGYRLMYSLVEKQDPELKPDSEMVTPADTDTLVDGMSVQLGDQVLYFEQVAGNESEPMLALVTSVLGYDHVSLCVFAPNGTAHARDNVVMVPNGIGCTMPFFARPKH